MIEDEFYCGKCGFTLYGSDLDRIKGRCPDCEENTSWFSKAIFQDH